MPELRAVIIGTGSYLPKRVVSNDDFAKTLDTSDEWINQRTGIRRRHFAADGELTSDLALHAARAALENAALEPADIDALILATATPDKTFPATATILQGKLGMERGFAFDVGAVCAGFIYALASANALIRAGETKRVMVLGAETFSRILDFEDRSTAVLFGDGAGAVILEAKQSERGIIATDLHTDGRFNELLYVDGGVSSTGEAGKLRMQGREIFKHAVQKLAATTEAALEKAGLGASDINWVIPHQANLRIIRATAEKLGIAMDQVVVTVEDQGNTSAASIPLAIDAANRAGKLRKNDIVVVEAIGGGLAWGAAVLRW